MGKNKSYNYFDTFIQGVDYSRQCAKMLHDSLQNFDISKTKERMETIHTIEHSADLAKHEMMSHLLREFITPIDREDIIILADAIDDLTDSIEDVMMHLYIYNIRELRPEAIEFSSVIMSCCDELKKMLVEFSNFKKSSTIESLLISVNEKEDEGDIIYAKSIRNLYTNCEDTIQILAWTGLFEKLEKCCDKCEDVADAVQSIIMQNT